MNHHACPYLFHILIVRCQNEVSVGIMHCAANINTNVSAVTIGSCISCSFSMGEFGFASFFVLFSSRMHLLVTQAWSVRGHLAHDDIFGKEF